MCLSCQDAQRNAHEYERHARHRQAESLVDVDPDAADMPDALPGIPLALGRARGGSVLLVHVVQQLPRRQCLGARVLGEDLLEREPLYPLRQVDLGDPFEVRARDVHQSQHDVIGVAPEIALDGVVGPTGAVLGLDRVVLLLTLLDLDVLQHVAAQSAPRDREATCRQASSFLEDALQDVRGLLFVDLVFRQAAPGDQPVVPDGQRPRQQQTDEERRKGRTHQVHPAHLHRQDLVVRRQTSIGERGRQQHRQRESPLEHVRRVVGQHPQQR